MDLKAKKSFSSGYTGNVEPGQMLFDVPHAVAVHFIENDLAEFAGKKGPAPKANGPGQPSLSSPAGQASQSNSANTFDNGTQPESAGQSQSTAHGSESHGRTLSTDLTAPGGNDTPKKRRGRPKK